jgi:molybdenum cofactor cytidylyltransferase
VLAAGASRRLGLPKQLLTVAGVPLVRSAAECGVHSAAARTAVIVGASASRVRRAVGALAVEIVENRAWAEGLSTSIRSAVAWAERRGLQGLLIALCDQPYLTSSHLNALLAAHAKDAGLACSVYAGTRGVPALFPSSYFARLRELSGDRGASALLQRAPHVSEIDWQAGALDVDTQTDVERLR